MTRVASLRLSRLSRTDWGLDTGTLTDVTPCTLEPTAWELDSRWSPTHRYYVAYRAVHGCRSCPALAWCTRQDPPQHDCMQAGQVWWRGKPYDLPAFHRLTTGGTSDPG